MRDPWFALVIIVVLGFGIGANTAIFSLVNATLVRPLPYPEGSRLVVIWDRLAKLGLERFPVTYANYLDYKAGSRVSARISLPENQYRDGRRVAALYRDLLDRVRTTPGVQSTGLVSRLPLTGGRGGDPFSIEGRPYDAQGKTPQVVNQQAIAGDYFSTMQIPLIQGRFFEEHERAPVGHCQ